MKNNATKRLIILGAGGHGKVAADCAEATGEFELIAFLDGTYPNETQVGPWAIWGKCEDAVKFDSPETYFFVAIGNNTTRQSVLLNLLLENLKIASLIHPSCHISHHSDISNGVLVCANATINPMVVIGTGSIVNTGASVDHDCVIGDYTHVSVGVRLAGAVKLGNRSFLGINSCVIQGLSIGNDCTLGAGATLIDDLPSNTTAVGTPAKVIKHHG